MTTQHRQFLHPTYRPDIDGLRAIAVLSVVAFHAFPDLIKGGFTGVDIFFVISGFLISTIIFKNLENGTFSFTGFYGRRIRRIFPALLVVLIACYAFGWITLLADEYKQLGKHIAAGAAFVSNFVLWSEAGYFDNSSETKPLLHLWSLGIEEQFYIFWPLLLWFAWRQNFNLLTLTTIIASISFALNVNGVKPNAVATFYSPQTRFWELLIGSLLAWLALYKIEAYQKVSTKLDDWLSAALYRAKPKNNGINLADVLSSIGLILLAYGFWRISKESRFPGQWALIPVLGTTLIILAGPKAWVNRVILSNKVAVWFGVISFPLYLWHWPLLSFVRIVGSDAPSITMRTATVALSIALAWLTYKLVERPIRFGKLSKTHVSGLAMAMGIMGVVGFGTYTHDGLHHRQVVQLNTSLASGADGGEGGNVSEDCGINDENIRKMIHVCVKDRRGNVRFALMGDSKALALYPGLFRTSKEQGRWLFIGGNGSTEATTPLLKSDADTSRPLTIQAIDAIANNKEIEVVVLVAAIRAVFELSDGVKAGGNLDTYDYSYLSRLSSTNRFEAAFDEFNRVIGKFLDNGKRVILVVDNPALPNPRDCIVRRTASDVLNDFLVKNNKACNVPLEIFNQDIKIYRELLAKLQSSHPPGDVEIFDPTEIYCEGGVCPAIKDGRLLYSYTDHISDYASGLVGRSLNDLLIQTEK